MLARGDDVTDQRPRPRPTRARSRTAPERASPGLRLERKDARSQHLQSAACPAGLCPEFAELALQAEWRG